MATSGRKRRADAEQSIRAILAAAALLLDVNPAATMEQVAQAAGVSRATVHRHFASREALVARMAAMSWEQVADAVDRARPESAAPEAALHEATVRILRLPMAWPLVLERAADRQVAGRALAGCALIFRRARDAGLIAAQADPEWCTWAYLALIGAARGATRNGVARSTAAQRGVAQSGADRSGAARSGAGGGRPAGGVDAVAGLVVATVLYGAVGRPAGGAADESAGSGLGPGGG